MDLSVAFLGTGGSVPSARRSTASVLVARGGERLLFDCGEGTQRQMQRSLGLVQVDEIYLTHFHADHFLGLPGLLKTYDLTDREAPLTIYGPRGLRELFKTLEPADRPARLRARAGRARAGRRGRRSTAYEVRAFAVEHSVRAYGYALVEDERPGPLRPRGGEARSASPKAPPSPPCSAARRSRAPTGRSAPSR